MEFHHVRGKNFELSKIGKGGGRSWALVKAEMGRCVVLCACCHRVRHANGEGKQERVVGEEKDCQLEMFGGNGEG